jgi:diguanylate cyclase (GGDEF)-like protein/PAS domain S-box-containing protein
MPMRKLLVVDDSPDVHDLVGVWLLEEKLELHSATDGPQCMELARSVRPDLILLDVDMPGANGLDVCRDLKAAPETRDIPVVFLSGTTTTETKLAGLELGAVDYITKPFDPAELRARVRASLRTKQLMDELEQQAATLRESEVCFRVLAENSSDVITRLSPLGKFLYVSPACASVLGYEALELSGRCLYDFVYVDDVANVRQCQRSIPVKGNTATTEYRFRRADGTDVWLEATFRPIAGPGGTEICEVHSSARDISARKQSEAMEQDRTAVLELIARDCSPQEVVSLLINAAERLLHGAASVILLQDGALAQIAPHLPAPLARAIDSRLYRFASDFCSAAAESQSLVITTDLLTDPRWAALAEPAKHSGLRYCSAALLHSARGDTLGMFSLFSACESQPSPTTSTFLSMACKLIAVSEEHYLLNGRLAHQARHDALTGLPNRSLFEDRLRAALGAAAANETSVGVCYLDLDRFKQINDTLGHQAGDTLLCKLVARFREHLGDNDLLARMGGDEFAMIMPDNPDPLATVGRMIESLRESFDIAGTELFVNISAGIAVYPRDGRDATTLQKNADVALYHVKNRGRNGMCCFSAEMNAVTTERIEIETALRQAVARDEIVLYYQPQVDHARRVVGVEALARWNHPSLGFVSPAKFIPIAEETGLIIPLGLAILRQAAAQAKQWVDAGEGVRVAVNVSAVQFAQPDFTDVVADALATAGLEGRWLEIELTESLLMANTHDAITKITRLKQLGVSIAIDDFGTGYSSLAYLQRLQIHTLKVDRSFVADIGGAGHSGAAAILHAVAAMARALGITLIAEGVETEIQQQFLKEIQCPVMQGFLFGRPEVAPAVVRKLAPAA